MPPPQRLRPTTACAEPWLRTRRSRPRSRRRPSWRPTARPGRGHKATATAGHRGPGIFPLLAAFVDVSGVVEFRDDIYGRDRRFADAIAAAEAGVRLSSKAMATAAKLQWGRRTSHSAWSPTRASQRRRVCHAYRVMYQRQIVFLSSDWTLKKRGLRRGHAPPPPTPTPIVSANRVRSPRLLPCWSPRTSSSLDNRQGRTDHLELRVAEFTAQIADDPN